MRGSFQGRSRWLLIPAVLGCLLVSMLPAATPDPEALVLFSLLRKHLAFHAMEERAGWEALQQATDPMPLGGSQTAENSFTCVSAFDAGAVYFELEMESTDFARTDSMEIWLSPDPERKIYHQFILGQDGSLTAFLRSDGGLRGVQTEAELVVTSAAPNWKARLRVPFASLGVAQPADNTRWGFNIARLWQGDTKKELSSWAAVKAFDQRSAFGELAFYSRAEVEADIEFWQGNAEDPLLRRPTVSGRLIHSESRHAETPASLWAYDPFSHDREETGAWGVLGWTDKKSATNRNRPLSMEGDYPAFFAAANALNQHLIALARLRMFLDEVERAGFYFESSTAPAIPSVPGHWKDLEEDYRELETRLDAMFLQYSHAFHSDRDAALLDGSHDRAEEFATLHAALKSRAEEFLDQIADATRASSDWASTDLSIPWADERRNAAGVPKRFWLSAFRLYGTEPSAKLLGPFRSWNIDWAFLLADRSADGSFSMPHAAGQFERMASNEQKINFQTGFGLTSFQAPTSEWLEERITKDDEILARSQDRVAIPKMRVGSIDQFLRRGINISHPLIRDYATEYLSHVLKEMNLDNRVDFVVTGWEESSDLRIREDGVLHRRQRGYDSHSTKAFQEYLRLEYGSIENLRREWRSGTYEKFSDIVPPDDRFLAEKRQPSPLIYHWERWQRKSHFEWNAHVYQSIKQAAPAVPVMIDNSHLFSDGTAWEAIRSGAADVLSYHHNPATEDAMFAYLASLARRGGVGLGYFENYMMMYSRPDGEDERLGARSMRLFFHNLISRDVRMLTFWLAYMSNPTAIIAAYGGSNYRVDVDQALLRWPTAEMVLFADRVARLERPLVESQASHGRMAVLVPDSTLLQMHYLNATEQTGPLMGSIIAFQNAVLTERNVPVEYIHEEMLAQGEADLSAFSALVVIDAAFMRPEVLGQIDRWTRQDGHTLVVVGAMGFFNQYGHALSAGLSPLRAAFPQLSVDSRKPWLIQESASPAPITKPLGEGTVVWVGAGLDSYLASLQSQKLASLRELVTGLGEAGVSTDQDAIRFQLRDWRDGSKLLLVANRDLRQHVTFRTRIDGPWTQIVDLGVPGSFPVPAGTQGDGIEFLSRLAPGDWTLLLMTTPENP